MPRRLWGYQCALLGLVLGSWYVPTEAGLLSPFFFGKPLLVLVQLREWFGSGTIFRHLAVTLLAFGCGTLLGASRRQLVRYVYWPAATSWVFSSLHTAVGMAFVGEYLGSAQGVGYLILQAEGVFDINAVIAGIVVLTICALLLDMGVSSVERRLLIWRPVSGQVETR